MRLWLNDEYYLQKEDIVGIFDMDSATVEPATKTALRHFEREGRLTVATEEIPVSFVVTAGKEGKHLYLTRNAPRVLCRRAVRRGS